MHNPTTAIALLAWLLISSATAATTTKGAERFTVGWLTTGFLAEIASRIEAARIDEGRLAGGYLQEDTGLLWPTADNGADVDWYAAEEFCRELEIADWSEWRMPSIEELESLHERRSEGIFKLPAAIRLTGCCPWSRTPSGEGSAWNFSFRYRKRFSGSLNYSYQLRALCVRSATPEDVLFFEQAAAERKEYEKLKRKGKL